MHELGVTATKGLLLDGHTEVNGSSPMLPKKLVLNIADITCKQHDTSKDIPISKNVLTRH